MFALCKLSLLYEYEQDLRAAQTYLAALAAVSVFGKPSVASRAYYHDSFILVLVWSAYVYRDVYPLATLDRVPADSAEGPFFYAKFSLLTIAAVFIPLFVPRKYVPVNPKVCFSGRMPELHA